MEYCIALKAGPIDVLKVVLSSLTLLVSLGTFIYLILSTRRASITETITRERVDWIRQTRKALLDFAHYYRAEDKGGMKEAKACIELLTRRDTPEYRLVLEHLDGCITDENYDESNYEKLLGLSAYILARAWQRIKLDGSKIWTNNEKKNDLVTYQVHPMIDKILSGTYTENDPDTSYYIIKNKGRKPSLVLRRIGNSLIAFLCTHHVEKIILQHPAVEQCTICKTRAFRNNNRQACITLASDYKGSIERVRTELNDLCDKKLFRNMIPTMKISESVSGIHEYRKAPTMSENKPLTGYPSIDKPWLKYYKEGAEEAATNIPEGKTVWDVIEEKLRQHKDISAIEYFGRVISRPEFIDMVYTWARAFKALGVKEDEVVPYYGPFFPDVGAMAFALNIIGACPYFLKLAISPETLAEETKDSRIAIVYDEMWANVSSEFSKDRFEKVIIVKATDAMPNPKKQIVSLLGKLKHDKNTPKISRGGKYLNLARAKECEKDFHGEVRVPFVSDRPAFITSSSGTTVGGVVKGCVATNESTIAQLYMREASEDRYIPGDRCLTNFPPTASTSLNCLFILSLYRGMVTVFDPRVSEQDFYNQIIKLKPNIVIITGSMWESFFNKVSSGRTAGKHFDFSNAHTWIVGGEGTDTKKFKHWSNIVTESGGAGLLSGYGLSELFSAVCVEKKDSRVDFTKAIMSVGIPYAGITAGIFNQNGQELGYNQRGELWINSKSAMKCYYNKPELTNETLIDGWIHTGDLAEIDEDGFVYIWGRVKDTVTLSDGQEVHLFDIANKIKESDCIDDAIVLPMPTDNGSFHLVAHIVWGKSMNDQEKKDCLTALNKAVEECFPAEIRIVAWSEHDGMLPYSPTTLKKDKNMLSKQTTGYVQVIDAQLRTIHFVPTADGATYKMTFDKTQEDTHHA